MEKITWAIYIVCVLVALSGLSMVMPGRSRLTYGRAREKALGIKEAAVRGGARFNPNRLGLRRKQDREIYEGVSFMRNIIAVNKGKDVPADFLLEELAKREGVLRPAYIKMLGLIRLNKVREAAKVLEEVTNSELGREYSGILVKWDEIDPAELSEILISVQRSAREINITLQKKEDEVISDIIYLPVILNVIFIFINFLYVAYYIEQRDMLMQLF